MGTFVGERKNKYFELLRSETYTASGEAENLLTDLGWLNLYEHLRFVNEKTDLLDLSTREMIIGFVFESASKDPDRLLPLLKNHKVYPPTH